MRQCGRYLLEMATDTYRKVNAGFDHLQNCGVNLFVRGDASFGGEAEGGFVRIGARWSF